MSKLIYTKEKHFPTGTLLNLSQVPTQEKMEAIHDDANKHVNFLKTK